MNHGLRTLQFQSLSVSPHNVDMLRAVRRTTGRGRTGPVLWENTIIGDGGMSGFDVGIPEFRFHTYFAANVEVNFDNGDHTKWISASAGLAGGANGRASSTRP